MEDKLLSILLAIPAAVITFTVHGYAHAKVAYKLGDSTPKFQGKLTLNPSAHINWLGLAMIVLFGFGFSKPVETNPSAFKNYYKDDLKVSIAGPIANFITALIFGIIYGIYVKFIFIHLPMALGSVLILFMQTIIMYNLSIMIFNLLPLPGLDGFNVFRDLSPKNFYKWAEPLYQYQMIIIVCIIAFGSGILSIPVKFLYSVIMNLVGFIL